MTYSLAQRLTAEALGTALLLAIVVGSGIMGETLANGNNAVALLGNTIATGAGLYVLITLFGPVSGAHFNPAVTLVFTLKREMTPAESMTYMSVQIIAGAIGVWLTHAMFAVDILQFSEKPRSGPSQWLGEFIATFGLLMTILGAIRFRPESVAIAVGLFITAGYWFTSSTSFANPAVTIARTLSDSFAGIQPADAPNFIAAQIIGAVTALIVARWLFTPRDAA